MPVTDTLKRIDGRRRRGDRRSVDAGGGPDPAGRPAGLAAATAFERFPPGGPQAWTDEAALLEACKIPVHALPGEPTNLKVTVPADLARVDVALAGPRSAPRLAARSTASGPGSTAIRSGPGAPLALGGVEIAGAPRLHGHSDGDVALHAIADALLGAAGLGDLGRLFPAGPATPRASPAASCSRTSSTRSRPPAGGPPASTSRSSARARASAAYLDAMRDAIAAARAVSTPAAVSVKASTGNLGGDEGAGRSMSALAVAVVGPAR